MTTPFLTTLNAIHQSAPELYKAIWAEYYSIPHYQASPMEEDVKYDGHHFLAYDQHYRTLKVSLAQFREMDELYLNHMAPSPQEVGGQPLPASMMIPQMKTRLEKLGARINAIKSALTRH